MAKNKHRRIRFSRKFWKDLAMRAIQLIKVDASNGILQGEKAIDYYINGDGRKYPYSAYKANNFRRFTDGKRLIRYAGKKIASNATDRVNMTATGKLLRGLKVSNVSIKGFQIVYNPDDEMKVKGNEIYGRSVTDLSMENSDIIAGVVMEEFGRQINLFSKDNVVIDVGLRL